MKQPHYAITVVWSDDEDGWIADAPDLRSCSAFGRTPEEAVAELRTAMGAWLEAARANNLPIPEPRFQPRIAAAE